MNLRNSATAGTLSVFFFNDTATTEIYTLSLHDALPILRDANLLLGFDGSARVLNPGVLDALHRLPPDPKTEDRKSTRLNSSHLVISYAVFCLKKKTYHSECSRDHLSVHLESHRFQLPRH